MRRLALLALSYASGSASSACELQAHEQEVHQHTRELKPLRNNDTHGLDQRLRFGPSVMLVAAYAHKVHERCRVVTSRFFLYEHFWDVQFMVCRYIRLRLSLAPLSLDRRATLP